MLCAAHESNTDTQLRRRQAYQCSMLVRFQQESSGFFKSVIQFAAMHIIWLSGQRSGEKSILMEKVSLVAARMRQLIVVEAKMTHTCSTCKIWIFVPKRDNDE